MPVNDCGEGFVDVVARAREMNVPIIAKDSLQSYSSFLRKGAADRLLDAARNITVRSNGALAMQLYDGFRPLAVQRKLFEEIKNDIAQKEGLQGRALWERVTQFIADPDLCPPHSTGGAVDCTIVSLAHGTELAMGTPVDTIDDRSYMWHPAVEGVERRNREMLFDVMTEAGFVNLATEWWHYSFGDQYWAVFHEKPHAVYGSAESID